MVVRRNDRLGKIFSGINTDRRFTTWLWFYLGGHALYPGEFKSFGMRDRMAEIIKNDPRLKQKIELDRYHHLIPEENLNWITNDKRQNQWIVRKLAERNLFGYITGITSLTDRDLSIATIDIWNIPQIEKIPIISEIASEWGNQEKADKIYDWFNGIDEKNKINLAWEIASKNYSLLISGQEQFKETANLINFMDTPCFSIADKKLFIDSVKKRWSQNKYRAKMTGKNQYNFILSDKAIKRLDKLAEKHEIKRTQVLEILLQMEEEKGIYIPERIKVIMGI